MEEQRERKSAAAALDSAEKQAKSQKVLLRNTEDQLTASKTQIVTLKKKLEEAEKAKVQAERARDQAEQDGYDARVAETEEALRAEVPGYVGITAPRRGMKLSTRPRLRLHLHIGRQRTSTTPLPSGGLFPLLRGLMSSPRWQR